MGIHQRPRKLGREPVGVGGELQGGAPMKWHSLILLAAVAFTLLRFTWLCWERMDWLYALLGTVLAAGRFLDEIERTLKVFMEAPRGTRGEGAGQARDGRAA